MARWLARQGAVAIALERPQATMFVNAQVLSDGLAVNERASLLLKAHRAQPCEHSWVFGPAIVVGPREANRLRSIPDEFLNLATYQGMFEVQVGTYGEPGQWAGNDLLFRTWDEAYTWGLGLAGRWTQAQHVRAVPAVNAQTLQRWVDIVEAHARPATGNPALKHRHAHGIRACYNVAELAGAITRDAEHVRAYRYQDLLLLQRDNTRTCAPGPGADGRQESRRDNCQNGWQQRSHSRGHAADRDTGPGEQVPESLSDSGYRERWLAVRHGVTFAVPDLPALIAQRRFRSLIERICSADDRQLNAGRF
ncbi:hypothetical protein [Kineosporia sp. NBRC 101677]|uniref:hypothetical protein n=1 Tax=Kineosporia sp. NBRC 101677 TaxID=3032197 RepID=UPI002552FDD0|nr:hypothetical protein [Kineosporia sp. NBRC 101677]